MATATQDRDRQKPGRVQPTPKGRLGVIVAASMAIGLLAALALVAAPFVPAKEIVLTGVVLLAFAFGWALLAVLSARSSDQPQRWAVAPAVFMALAGLVSLIGSDAVRNVFGWVWPPLLLGLVVWMFIRARRQLRSRIGRWMLYPILAVLVVASVGGGFQTVRQSIDTKADRMPGQLVDVGGHRMHLHCTGSGSPTVVLEPGQGGASTDFGLVAPVVARDSTVCVYDRAGRGWSDAADGRQDALRIAADLHTLLERAQVPGPYVLAGHSFGGLYVQTFAAHYPDQVAGLVLLDSTAPKPGPALPTRTASYDVLGRVSAVFSAVAHPYLASWIEEFVAASTSMQQAGSLTSLDDKPLVVVTADTGNAAGWEQAQDRMAALSTNSSHRVAKDTTHETLVYDEADSAVASQAIRDVVRSVRAGSQLVPR